MISDIDEFNIQKPLSELGVDSVMTVDVRRKLQMTFKIGASNANLESPYCQCLRHMFSFAYHFFRL
ncbi:hypothetical protein F5Y09DRAFT_310611 [Xylaria sp. FL1042]|nr:hypothetical protein F5Y09DRAFT_310611 [Xylaria sp. FL1042]